MKNEQKEYRQNTDKSKEITGKEWNALLLTVQEYSDLQAYKQTFPNATDSTAKAQACRYFRRIRDKLTTLQELELFNLGRGRFYKELEKRLNAETPIFYQGKKIDIIHDNTTQLKATELLAKLNGLCTIQTEVSRNTNTQIVFNMVIAGEEYKE